MSWRVVVACGFRSGFSILSGAGVERGRRGRGRRGRDGGGRHFVGTAGVSLLLLG